MQRGSGFVGRCWIGACSEQGEAGEMVTSLPLLSFLKKSATLCNLLPRRNPQGPGTFTPHPLPGSGHRGHLGAQLLLAVGSQTFRLLASVPWDSEQVLGLDPCLQGADCVESAFAPGLASLRLRKGDGSWPQLPHLGNEDNVASPATLPRELQKCSRNGKQLCECVRVR